MVDILTPQRFYQIEFMVYDGTVCSVLDLKQITQIELFKGRKDGVEEIAICRNSERMSIRFDNGKSASEEYAKLVTAWTTYKLATEK